MWNDMNCPATASEVTTHGGEMCIIIVVTIIK